VAVVHEGQQTSSGTASTSLVLTKPASLAVGELMLAVATQGVSSAGDAVTTPASGWTTSAVQKNVEAESTFWAWKIADSGDVAASNFTWTMNNARVYHGHIARLSGADGTTPVNQSDLRATSSSTSHTTGSITPSVDNCMIVAYFVTGSGSVVWSLDATLTSRYSASLQSLPACYGDVMQTTAAAVTKTSTFSAGSSNAANVLIFAIAPSSGAPPPELTIPWRPRRMPLGV
jgi:hypothetical protein